jgi:hypothetical protein
MARPHRQEPAPRPLDPAIEVIAGVIDAFQQDREAALETIAPAIEAAIKGYPAPARDLARLPAEQAQDLVDEAAALGGPRGAPKAVAALRLDPWHVPAWEYLAGAFPNEAALGALFQRIAVYAAERAISPARAEELAGRYAGDAAGRQLIAAKVAYARYLGAANRWWDAFRELDQAFQLDREDRLNVRWELFPVTILVHDLDFAEYLAEEWTFDNPGWPYLCALTEYARWGATPQARDLLLKAYHAAPAVTTFLVSPGSLPKETAPAEEWSAYAAAKHIHEAFKRYGGTLAWVQETTGVRASFAPLRHASSRISRRRR